MLSGSAGVITLEGGSSDFPTLYWYALCAPHTTFGGNCSLSNFCKRAIKWSTIKLELDLDTALEIPSMKRQGLINNGMPIYTYPSDILQ